MATSRTSKVGGAGKVLPSYLAVGAVCGSDEDGHWRVEDGEPVPVDRLGAAALERLLSRGAIRPA